MWIFSLIQGNHRKSLSAIRDWDKSSIKLGSWGKVINNKSLIKMLIDNTITQMRHTINPVGVFPFLVNWLMAFPWLILPWQRARNLYFTFKEKYRNDLHYLASCYRYIRAMIIIIIIDVLTYYKQIWKSITFPFCSELLLLKKFENSGWNVKISDAILLSCLTRKLFFFNELFK